MCHVTVGSSMRSCILPTLRTPQPPPPPLSPISPVRCTHLLQSPVRSMGARPLLYSTAPLLHFPFSSMLCFALFSGRTPPPVTTFFHSQESRRTAAIVMTTTSRHLLRNRHADIPRQPRPNRAVATRKKRSSAARALRRRSSSTSDALASPIGVCAAWRSMRRSQN